MGLVVGGYLGLLLVGATYLALGFDVVVDEEPDNAYPVGVLLCAFSTSSTA
ncbi:MAG: hypothetical protein U1F43_12525 [Myxococcota bacterium]